MNANVDNDMNIDGNADGAVIREPTVFSRRPTIQGLLDFSNKLHSHHYENGCEKCIDDYDVDAPGRHAFIAALTFKAKRMSWLDENTGIFEIATGMVDANGNDENKNLLKSDGKFELGALSTYFSLYINL